MADKLKKIENGILFGLLALFPVFLLPSLSNPVITAKLILLSLALVSIVVLKALRNISSKTKGIVFGTSPLDLPVILVAAAYLISGYLVTPNRMEAFWLPGTASFVVGGALLYFIVHQLSEKSRDTVKLGLITGAGLLSIFSIAISTGITKGISSLPAYLKNDIFNVSGSQLGAAIFFICLLPLMFELLAYSEKTAVKAIAGVAMGLVSIALVMSVVTIVRNWNQTQLPSLATSWIVATEALKERPFMGTGPSNYVSAFTRFIPLQYNGTNQWNLRFPNANSFYLTLITETGLFGFAAMVILLIALYKRVRTTLRDARLTTVLPVIMIVVFFAVFPSVPLLILLFFVLLALITRTHVMHFFTPAHEEQDATSEGKLAIFLIAVPVIGVALFASYLTARAAQGEISYQNSLKALVAQDGKKAYDTLRDTITISPFSDRYHLSYSQLNLALANTLAQKKNLTTEDKNTISQLVQQSIREGRSAVVLNRERAVNWENLANIYKAVMPLAKGADQFAIQTYSQAISLDPTNPNTRLSLGGVFYGLKRYEEAIDVFRLAAATKPDFANAHYNLAIAYRDNGQFDKALAELSTVLTLIPADSNDYKVAKKELENVQSKAPKKNAAASGDNIKAPEVATGSAQLPEKVDLPSDATPPALESNP